MFFVFFSNSVQLTYMYVNHVTHSVQVVSSQAISGTTPAAKSVFHKWATRHDIAGLDLMARWVVVALLNTRSRQYGTVIRLDIFLSRLHGLYATLCNINLVLSELNLFLHLMRAKSISFPSLCLRLL